MQRGGPTLGIGCGAVARLALAGLALLAAPAQAGSPAPPATWLERLELTGDWGGERTRLAERGVVPYAQYFTGFWANVHGGLKTGIRPEAFARFGLDLDLERLRGWASTRFHIGWHSYHGGQPSEQLVGQFPTDAVSGWEAARSVRFYEIYLEQQLWRGALLLKAGQLAADDDFLGSLYAAPLLNAAFSFFSSGRARQGAPFYPLAAPGLYAMAQPGERWTLRAGAYTADPGDDESSNFGFGWSLDEGATFFASVTTHRRPAGRPGVYTLGARATTAAVQDYGSGQTVDGDASLYAKLDQALVLDAAGEPRLGTFLRAAFDPREDRSVERVAANGGLSLFGPIPGRQRDVLAFGVAFTDLGSDYVSSVSASGQSVTGHEWVLELGYRAALAGWLTLQPDFQVVLDPIFSGRDAYVIGLEAAITF